MPPIITVTTDFGLQDEYVGVMKGILAALAPQAERIDLCHTIAPQNVAQAAFLLEAAAPYFPAGTIHLAVVDPGVGTPRELLVVQAMDHYFLAPDNGLLSHFFNEARFQAAFIIDCPHLYRQPLSATFHGRDILAPVAAALANGSNPSSLGRQALKENLTKLVFPTLQIDRIHGNIAGSVIHIDHFGNLTTNIRQGDLADLKADPASIQIFHKNQQVSGLTSAYASRPAGHVLALIGSRGYLELAVSKGNAAKILGGEVGDPVRVTLPKGA